MIDPAHNLAPQATEHTTSHLCRFHDDTWLACTPWDCACSAVLASLLMAAAATLRLIYDENGTFRFLSQVPHLAIMLHSKLSHITCVLHCD